MQIRRLISKTNYAADRKVSTHHPRIYNLTKTHLESSPSVVKHPPEFNLNCSCGAEFSNDNVLQWYVLYVEIPHHDYAI